MKNHSIVFVLLSCFLVFTSCDDTSINPAITPSDVVTMEEQTVSLFDELKVTGEFEVFVTFSETEEKVIVEANDNLHDLIILDYDGDELEIRMKSNTNINGNETIKVHITTKEIDRYSLTGESSVSLVNELTAGNIAIDLTGESRFEGTVDLTQIEADLTGESRLNLAGKATDLNITLTGDSQMKDYNFVCQDLDINLSGESQAFLTVTNRIDVNGSGESILHFKGDAGINNQFLAGDAKVQKED